MHHSILPRTLLALLLTLTSVHAAAVTVTQAAAPEPTSTSYSSPKDFQDTLLIAHNFFREEHNVLALTWNKTLADFGANVAKGCVFEHSGGPYGENLAAGYANATAAVEGWGNERQSYNFKKPTGFSEKTGHFTQVVWKGTTQVGCGVTNCAGKNKTPGFYVVCEYAPRGNVVGEDNTFFKQNVLKQTKGKDTDTVASGITSAATGVVSTVTRTRTVLGLALLLSALLI